MQSAMNPNDHQRVPAKLEEIIVNADLLDAQQLLPDFGDLPLQLRAGRDEASEKFWPRVLHDVGLSGLNTIRIGSSSLRRWPDPIKAFKSWEDTMISRG